MDVIIYLSLKLNVLVMLIIARNGGHAKYNVLSLEMTTQKDQLVVALFEIPWTNLNNVCSSKRFPN